MAKIRTLQILRGTTAQNDAYTGSAGELTMDTTTNELRLHDGSTAGGHIIYNKSDVNTALLNKADVDLSNINASSTAIETIVGWGIPDFSRQATLSNGTTPALATQNMYVWGALPANGYFYVNTTNTYDPNSNDKRRFGAQNGWSGGNCIVPKGCYYYANTTSGSLYWCPLKGE